MSQYINLYPHLGLGERDWLTGAKLLQWMGVALLLVTLLGLADGYRYMSSRDQAERIAAQLNSVQGQLALLLAERQGLGSDQALQQSIKDLQAQQERKRELLARLTRADDETEEGVARYLVGLGSRPPRDLWFTRIDVREGGQQMSLSGHTRSADSVPAYLRVLRNEPAFSGQHFSLLQIAANEDSALLDFVIRSTREGE